MSDACQETRPGTLIHRPGPARLRLTALAHTLASAQINLPSPSAGSQFSPPLALPPLHLAPAACPTPSLLEWLSSSVKMMSWWSSSANSALDEQIDKATSSSLYAPFHLSPSVDHVASLANAIQVRTSPSISKSPTSSGPRRWRPRRPCDLLSDASGTRTQTRSSAPST